ncbi:MAG: hypothetical protein HY077_10740 [Elusimicrobia bacterium]|nr:hypothetical protein [Elusimicrobiota bacterium]
MMKSNAMLRGSSAGLAAVIQVDTTVGFLLDRQQAVDLAPIGSSPSGYVWRRVFLQGKGHRA